MEEQNSNRKSTNQKNPKKRKSQWVYVKIGTRIVDVKKVFISADEDWDHIKESSTVVTQKEEKRNSEIWNWASGGKSIAGQKTTKNMSQTLTKFVYKNEPKVVESRGRTTKKVKSTLHPTLPKIVRSSPTPSPPARASLSSTNNSPLITRKISKKDISSSKKVSAKLPGRNPNSIKLNPINDSSLHKNKIKKSQKTEKTKPRKSEKQVSSEDKSSADKDSILKNDSNANEIIESKEILDEGFASDYSGTCNGSNQDNTSGETTPMNEESKFSKFSDDTPNIERKVRSNSVPHDGRHISNTFQSSSHIIRLTNSFKIEAENTNNSKDETGESNGRGQRFTLEMTEVVDVNLSDEIELTKEGEEDAQFSCDIDSLIDSEAKKLMKLNINNALDEIQTEDRLSIVLQV